MLKSSEAVRVTTRAASRAKQNLKRRAQLEDDDENEEVELEYVEMVEFLYV